MMKEIAPMETPDCVHCRFMMRQQNGEYRCRQHDMTLHSPVSIFCKQISPPADDKDYEQWFSEVFEDEDLDGNTLYTWVKTTTRDAQGNVEKHVDRTIVAPLTSYLTWSAGTFWRVVRNLRQNQRDFYTQHGYDIED